MNIRKLCSVPHYLPLSAASRILRYEMDSEKPQCLMKKAPDYSSTGAKIVYQKFTIYPLIEVFLGRFYYNAYTPILIANPAKYDCS